MVTFSVIKITSPAIAVSEARSHGLGRALANRKLTLVVYHGLTTHEFLVSLAGTSAGASQVEFYRIQTLDPQKTDFVTLAVIKIRSVATLCWNGMFAFQLNAKKTWKSAARNPAAIRL